MTAGRTSYVIAVLDANILYSAPLRDFFMWQAANGVFAARWTDAIHDQCQRAGVPFFFKQVGGRTPKAGGRMLDGRTWNEFPQVPSSVGDLPNPDLLALRYESFREEAVWAG